jgi:putative tryptophan/tyrosine transport system substrate-binding protein
MKRREFIALLGGSIATPVVVHAQQAAMPVIGCLFSGTPESGSKSVAAFRQGLKEAGYIVDQNVMIEYRWAEGDYSRLAGLAAELVQRHVTAIFAEPTPAALAAKSATSNIPIVFDIGGDPVKIGLVDSLNRPNGNLTGLTFFTVALTAKRLEILHELVPTPGVIGVLANQTNPNARSEDEDVQAAARALGQQLLVLNASTEADIDKAFATFAQTRIGAFLLGNDPFFTTRREQLATLAARYAIPAMFPHRDYAAAGGLMSYGTNVAETFRQAGIYTGRILGGAKPADLPIMQPTKFELVVNLKTAGTLNLSIPATLLAQADEVIE